MRSGRRSGSARTPSGSEALDGAPLRLRVGINTGEALVRLGVTPGSGERFLAGDAINTASRIQSVAPEMGVAVGLGRTRRRRRSSTTRSSSRRSLKGKTEPVRVFHARAPRARLGVDLTRTHDTPYVGREIDLALLKGLFDKTVAASSSSSSRSSASPGSARAGSSPSCARHADAGPEPVTWRQGRCLPYGEGITFWALGEIVKAHAGILESDAPEVAIAKLEAVLPDGAERDVAPPAAAPAARDRGASSADREEQFTAWRRFLEHVAEDRPTVLVFEDLHWADEAMLAFLEHLADRAEGVPLLIVGTARPELYERHPAFAARLRNANRINLGPLSDRRDRAPRRRRSSRAPCSRPSSLHPILERAEGNPLYAEEFVRLLRDRDLLVRTRDGWRAERGRRGAVARTRSSALIAARLDTLPAERKSLLADAAVVGKVFWAGAVAAMGERDVAEVTETLRELARKELVQPARRELDRRRGRVRLLAHPDPRRRLRASFPERRGRRATSRRPGGSRPWPASRLEDLADVLAYHYATALALARAAGQTEQAAELETPALRFLTLAGERALGLDTDAALATPRTGPRGSLLPDIRSAQRLLPDSAPPPSRPGGLPRPRPPLRRRSPRRARRGICLPPPALWGALSVVATNLGDARQWTFPSAGPGAARAAWPVTRSRWCAHRSRPRRGTPGETSRSGPRRRTSARDRCGTGLPRPARAIGYLGTARFGLGDPRSLDDFRDAIDLATRGWTGPRGSPVPQQPRGGTLGFEGPAASLEVIREGIAYAEARGLTEIAPNSHDGHYRRPR